MLKRISVIVACIVVCFCLLNVSSTVMADDPSGKITGKVKDVDMDEHSVIVGDSGKDVVVYIEKNTQIQQGTNKKALGDIKVGAIIEIKYIKVEDDLIAQSISII